MREMTACSSGAVLETWICLILNNKDNGFHLLNSLVVLNCRSITNKPNIHLNHLIMQLVPGVTHTAIHQLRP